MSETSEHVHLTIDGAAIALDPEGYLQNMQEWQPSVAEALAEREGRMLDERHWEVLNVLRDFYMRYELSPSMRPLIKALKQSLGEEKGTSMYLMMLFPEGAEPESPARIGARLAGLPKPTNCH